MTGWQVDKVTGWEGDKVTKWQGDTNLQLGGREGSHAQIPEVKNSVKSRKFFWFVTRWFSLIWEGYLFGSKYLKISAGPSPPALFLQNCLSASFVRHIHPSHLSTSVGKLMWMMVHPWEGWHLWESSWKWAVLKYFEIKLSWCFFGPLHVDDDNLPCGAFWPLPICSKLKKKVAISLVGRH